MNPMDLKRGIDKTVKAAVIELKALSTPCADSKAITQVGTISANSDTEIGEIIASAMQKVGNEGVITVEEGQGLEKLPTLTRTKISNNETLVKTKNNRANIFSPTNCIYVYITLYIRVH